MKNISKAKVLDLKVAQPSRFEQDRFAEKLAWIRRTRARTANHQAHLDTLFVTLQSRAFAGEL